MTKNARKASYLVGLSSTISLPTIVKTPSFFLLWQPKLKIEEVLEQISNCKSDQIWTQSLSLMPI